MVDRKGRLDSWRGIEKVDWLGRDVQIEREKERVR